MDLESIAAELSVLPPAEFVPRRTELAKAARDEATAASGKDAGRALAESVKHLTKPSVAAWAVNLLATRRPSELGKVARLGEDFRHATQRGDAAALTQLSGERRSVLREAGSAALELARLALDAADSTGGQNLSDAVRGDVEQTLQAALADSGALAAVRTGRLVRALASTGVEATDLTDAVAGPFDPPGPEDDADDDESAQADAQAEADADTEAEAGEVAPVRGRHDSRTGGSGADTAAGAAREAAAADARHALATVEHQLQELTELRTRARERSEALTDEIDDLEQQLADLTGKLDDRRAERDELEDRLDETDRDVGRLGRQRDKAARLAETTAKAAKR